MFPSRMDGSWMIPESGRRFPPFKWPWNGGRRSSSPPILDDPGRVQPDLSLAPVASYLAKVMGRPVGFADNCVGESAREGVASLSSGEIMVLENLRFHAEETGNSPEFARSLADLADVYVNDAFGTAHRAHASTEGITRFVSVSVAGLLMEKEIHYLTQALENPGHPFVAILGGAKVSDKIDVVTNLIMKVDALLVGGGMAYTFLRARGFSTGDSLVEEDKLGTAAEILALASERGVELLTPFDHVVADRFAADARSRLLPEGDPIPGGWMALDIGPQTVKSYEKRIESARTIVWNGPMGVFEMAPFASGTMSIARAVAGSPATSIIGGGDSVAAVHQAGVASEITHISTGGGASLDFLAGKTLPGVEALTDKDR